MTRDATSDPRLTRRLRDEVDDAGPQPDIAAAAAREDLIDVSVARMDSPIGPLLLAATRAGIARIVYLATHDEERVLDDLAREIGPRVLSDPERLTPAIAQLEEYLRGDRRRFELSVDLSHLPHFTRAVLDATAAIPPGEVRTYGEIAVAAGSPRGARAAGNALGSNPVPIVVPCHRVVRTGGALGGYTGGTDVKRHLLTLEGVPVGRA